ncbi:hypothetical protein K461DRAFT_282465 [Myriangium duriaei CBS 260.36]|uniref:DUF4267 domain-containing protein n=1 Tax=Myriangium duriaei CBS 260.36 TaxID=1168546 RepID=A0A9P4IV37_9PEZI|nr:hypothetical protein K461DRAFT_282465 [Myriangium duriaei CBS 260.36]
MTFLRHTILLRRILVVLSICIATLLLKVGLYGIYDPAGYGFSLGLPFSNGPLRMTAIRNTVCGAGVLLTLYVEDRKQAGQLLVLEMWTSLIDITLCWLNAGTLWAVLAHSGAGAIKGAVGWALQRTGKDSSGGQQDLREE